MMNQSSYYGSSKQDQPHTPVKSSTLKSLIQSPLQINSFKLGIISQINQQSSPFIHTNNDCEEEKPRIFQVEDNVVGPIVSKCDNLNISSPSSNDISFL